MPATTTIKRPYCSNCEYWTGERKITRSGSDIYVAYELGQEECEVKGMGGAKVNGSQPANGCRKYKRWSHLPG